MAGDKKKVLLVEDDKMIIDMYTLKFTQEGYEVVQAENGKDGLDFYRLIAVQAKKFLATDGIIIVEIGIGQKNDIEEIFKKNGLKLIEVAKDLAGIERTLSFQ